ncbi:hypothetical protein Tco_0519361 [Tanacetum coccineum]
MSANTKAIRALCVKPGTRLALLASLGKKLSFSFSVVYVDLSKESNTTVLTYDLPLAEDIENLKVHRFKCVLDLKNLLTQATTYRISYAEKLMTSTEPEIKVLPDFIFLRNISTAITLNFGPQNMKGSLSSLNQIDFSNEPQVVDAFEKEMERASTYLL